MNKNQVFTAFIVMFSLFLGTLFFLEEDQARYRENVDKMLEAQELEYKMLDLKAQMLKTEMELVKLDTLLARAYGIDYRGLMNQTPSAY